MGSRPFRTEDDPVRQVAEILDFFGGNVDGSSAASSSEAASGNLFPPSGSGAPVEPFVGAFC